MRSLFIFPIPGSTMSGAFVPKRPAEDDAPGMEDRWLVIDSVPEVIRSRGLLQRSHLSEYHGLL